MKCPVDGTALLITERSGRRRKEGFLGDLFDF